MPAKKKAAKKKAARKAARKALQPRKKKFAVKKADGTGSGGPGVGW